MSHDFWTSMPNWARELLSALTPAMLGSAVGQAWSQGLSWRQRIVQWLVGIMVSYYVTQALTEWLHFGPFASQALGFVIAMMAFETAPKFIAGVSAATSQIPDIVMKFVSKWTS